MGPDRRSFFMIVRSFAQECVPLLESARRRGLAPNPAALAPKEHPEVRAKMVSGLMSWLDGRSA